MRRQDPSVAVLGAGNQGTIMAGVLALAGFDVALFELPRFQSQLDPIRKRGGIEVYGSYGTGLSLPALLTKEIEEAVYKRDVLLFAVPAYGHAEFTRACAPFLSDGQLLVYISCFGAMRMQHLLWELELEADVTVSEILSCIYAGRRTKGGKAMIVKRKGNLPAAAFPARKTPQTLDVLNRLFGDLTPAANCLETSINNINPWVHVAGVVLNTGWIEASNGGFGFYSDGKTPSVRRLERAMDEERRTVAEALDLPAISTERFMQELYHDVPAQPTEEGKRATKVPDAPAAVRHRYLLEDVPYGIVPVALLADALDVETPILDAVIRLSSILVEEDLMAAGVHPAALGLAGLTAREMNQLVKDGAGWFGPRVPGEGRKESR